MVPIGGTQRQGTCHMHIRMIQCTDCRTVSLAKMLDSFGLKKHTPCNSSQQEPLYAIRFDPISSLHSELLVYTAPGILSYVNRTIQKGVHRNRNPTVWTIVGP